MKVWNKYAGEQFGKVHLIWFHKDTARFGAKLGSHLLGAFVVGILTSIFFAAIGAADLSLPMARLAFIVSYILGVVNAFLRAIYYGFEYRISEKALLAIRNPMACNPYKRTGMDPAKLRGEKIEYLRWNDLGKVTEENGQLLLELKNQTENALKLGVASVRRVILYSADDRKVLRPKKSGVWQYDSDLDKESIRLILQKIREAKKSAEF